MAIHNYNSEARRRIADSVRFTENFGRGPRGQNRRTTLNPGIVVIVDTAIEAGRIGTAKRAEGPDFDTGSDPGTDSFDVWNPSNQTVDAGARVVVYPVALKDAGTMWTIVAPFTGTTTAGSSVTGYLHSVSYALSQAIPSGSVGSAIELTFNSPTSVSTPAIFAIEGSKRFRALVGCNALVTFGGDIVGSGMPIIELGASKDDGANWSVLDSVQMTQSHVSISYAGAFEVDDLIRVRAWGGPSSITRTSMTIFGNLIGA